MEILQNFVAFSEYMNFKRKFRKELKKLEKVKKNKWQSVDDHDFTLPVKLAERGMPTAKSALPDPVKSPMAKEYPK